MKCSCCGGDLECGKLKFSDKLKWVSDGDKNGEGSLFKKESILLSEPSLLRFQSVAAYRCTRCRTIIIKY